MKKNSKKDVALVIVPILIFALLGSVLTYFCIKEQNKLSKYFEGDVNSAIPSYINNQYSINQNLMKIANNKNYTLDNAYVEVNPYKISPLSAIIIFQTKENVEVNVTINGVNYTKTEASKKHSIPIYGLYEDYTNVVTLEANGEKASYSIKTEKSNINYPLNVEYASPEITFNDIYFTVASYETWLTGWDKEGKLRFYLTIDNRMDVEWLDNGHFVIGVTQGQAREQFVGFVEMDYLGKVYNYYTLQNGYSFEFQILSDGKYMLAGGEQAIHMNEQWVYIMNPENGKVEDSINISEIVKEIDPDFPSKYLGAAAIRNGFYYDEESGDLLVSFREISTIWSLNFKTKKLNWVFTNQASTVFNKDVWKPYLITTKTGRYPMGQHTPQILSDGRIAFFNNGYDRYDVGVLGKSDKASSYTNAYSAVEIYEILPNNTARLTWQYNDRKNLFSIKYGLFRVDETNNHKLMNFGYVLTDDYRSSDKTVKESEALIDSMYTLELELDQNNKVYFKATCDEGKYRLFKHTLYNETTSNVDIGKLSYYDTVEKDKLKETLNKKVDLENASEWIYSLELTNNTLTTNYDIAEDDNIDLYFVNNVGKVFILNYKSSETTQKNRVFGTKLKGKYAVFVKVNDILYNANKVYEF